MADIMIAKCPRCGNEAERTGNTWWPFCSERCKLLDLGNWISESYRIPQKSTDEDEDGAMPSPSTPEQG